MKQIYPRTKGAASYKVQDNLKFSIPWLILWFLLILEAILFFQESQILVNLIFWTIAIFIPLQSTYVAFEALIIETVFTTRPRLGPDLQHEDWEVVEFTGWGGFEPMGYFLPFSGESNGLIIYMHGYGSSSAYNESRMLHLRQQGYDIGCVDMRGHGRCDLTRDWTLLKVIADLECFIDKLVESYGVLPKKVHFYGHSTGGLVALRLSAKRSGWWKDNLESVMLESPVTSFPMVIDYMIGPHFRILRPLVRRIIRREMERIHPDLSIRWDDSKVPHIGLPKLPILVLQAMNDELLGRNHYDLLAKTLEGKRNNKLILIDELMHTSTQDCQPRKDLVEKWLGGV
jgi:pimeloyl-ACP methyl ester carboxylesterase